MSNQQLQPFRKDFGQERDPVEAALANRQLTAERARLMLGAALHVLRSVERDRARIDMRGTFLPVTAAHVSVSTSPETTTQAAPQEVAEPNPIEAMVAQYAQPSEVIRNAFEESSR